MAGTYYTLQVTCQADEFDKCLEFDGPDNQDNDDYWMIAVGPYMAADPEEDGETFWRGCDDGKFVDEWKS